MNWYRTTTISSVFIFIATTLTAQDDPMVYQRWNIFSINKIATRFNNTGMLCDGNNQNFSLARPPALEYPNGSGVFYGTCVGVVVGAPAQSNPGAWSGENPNNWPILDGTMDEGPADFWDEEHFAPYPSVAGNFRAPMSDDPGSWPEWPATYPDSDQPLEIGSEGWPGAGPGGDRIAEQESFAAMYAWPGTDPQSPNRRYLKTQLICRGLAWTGSLYEDFLVFIYVVRNIGTAAIVDLRMGIHLDLSFVAPFMGPNYDADRHYYDPKLQLAYAWDDNSYEILADGRTLGAEEIPWGGAMVLKMPGATGRVLAYDASHFWEGQTSASGSGGAPEMYFRYNLLNENDPHDSNGDGIDDDFDGNGVADAEEGGIGYYVGSGADGLQILGSGPITLEPDAADTMIFAIVFGDNNDDLVTNASRALTLYQNNWRVVTAPPAPVVEAVAGDRQVTLYWSTKSEKDPEFQGYKIYRSTDNGVTWGTKSFKDFDGAVHYIPLAQYDLVDGILGNYTTLPEYAWYNLGVDEWVPFRRQISHEKLLYFQPGDSVNVFIDRDVINGFKYWYYVAAYDSGNGIIGPLENTPATDPAQENNTVVVIPHGASALSEMDLATIKVVPNPYILAASWEQGRDKQVQFVHLPENASIRIFNTAGENVITLHHSAATALAPGIATWNLKNYNDQLVAPGIYFYHVEAPMGEFTGQFVIIH